MQQFIMGTSISVGTVIKQLRTSSEMTQAILAKKLRISRATLAGYETNIRQPSLEMVVEISKTFDVTTDYLLGVEK